MAIDLETKTPITENPGDNAQVFGAASESANEPDVYGFLAIWNYVLAKITASAATVRTALGLGTIATQNSASVSITGGSVSGITDLAVSDGGTGASSADAARFNLGLGDIATLSAPLSFRKVRARDARELLGGEEGIAISFVARRLVVEDFGAHVLNADGLPEDFLTIARASSATYVGRDRLLKTASSNVLRYDHDPATGVPLGALIEGARTNLALYSEQFSSWTEAVGVSITSDATTAPDGSANGDKVVETTANSAHYLRRTYTLSPSTTYTSSLWMKAGERTVVTMLCYGGNSFRSAHFDLSAGTVVTGATGLTGSESIEVYPNGWYRCVITFTVSATGSTYYADIRLSNDADNSAVAGTGDIYTGDGTSGLYVFGWQLEAGAHASSYIATTSASATRAADSVSTSGGLFPVGATGECTLYWRGTIQSFPTASTYSLIETNDGTGAEKAAIRLAVSSVDVAAWDNSSLQIDTGPEAVTTGAEQAFAVRLRANDALFYADGAQSAADTSCTLPTIDRLAFDLAANGGAWHVSEVMVINRAMTAAELAELTA